MNLKKIDSNLQKALQENKLETANELQEDTFSYIKSGVDLVIQSPEKSGKSTTIVLNVIQKLKAAQGEGSRALILVQDKEKVLEMTYLFSKFCNYNNLRYIGVHEKGDIEFDKNQISAGNDVLIGTPRKINELFSTAGFNGTTIKMFVVDDTDLLFKTRMDVIVLRLAQSIEKTQKIFFCNNLTEKVENLADQIMIEPLFCEFE